MSTTSERRQSIQVIERMLKLLDALAQHEQSVSLKRLSHLTGLHPSSAHRILASMVQGHIVDRAEPGAYRLGLKLIDLGDLARVRLDVRHIALPHMTLLHAELGETVNLVVRQGDDVVYVERVPPPARVNTAQVIGRRAPLHVTAAGKAFLAHEGEEGCRRYAARTGLPAYTQNTLSQVEALVEEILTTHQRGYALDREEAEPGLCCVSAGIYDADRRIIAALSISAQRERLRMEWAPRLGQAADAIAKAMHAARSAD